MNGTPWKKRKQSSSGTSFRNLRIYMIIESGNYVYYFQYQTYDSVLLKRRRRGRLRRRPYFYRIDIHLRIPYPDHCARITVHPKLNVTQEERKHQIVLTKQRPRDDGSVHIYPKETAAGIKSNWTGARDLFAEENCCRPDPSHREIFRHTQQAWNHGSHRTVYHF